MGVIRAKGEDNSVEIRTEERMEQSKREYLGALSRSPNSRSQHSSDEKVIPVPMGRVSCGLDYVSEAADFARHFIFIPLSLTFNMPLMVNLFKFFLEVWYKFFFKKE